MVAEVGDEGVGASVAAEPSPRDVGHAVSGALICYQ